MRKRQTAILTWLKRVATSAKMLILMAIYAVVLLFVAYFSVEIWGTDNFREAFWANALATLFGIIIGLPVAMWLNRIAINLADRSNRSEQRRLLIDCLVTLLPTIRQNQEQLDIVASELDKARRRWLFAPARFIRTGALNTYVWDAVKHIVMQFLNDPALQGQLATYFGVLNEINNSVRLHRDRVIAEVGGLIPIGKSHELIREGLVDMASRTRQVNESLAAKVEAKLIALSSEVKN